MYFKKFELTETNKLPYAFHDAGQFYFGWTDSWLKKKNFFNSNSKFIELGLKKGQEVELDKKTAKKFGLKEGHVIGFTEFQRFIADQYPKSNTAVDV